MKLLFTEHPACAIIAYYKNEKSILSSLPWLAVLLYKENLIGAIILLNADAILKEVEQSICANHQNLKKFADVLMLISSTQRIAREIADRYCELTNFVFHAHTERNPIGKHFLLGKAKHIPLTFCIN